MGNTINQKTDISTIKHRGKIYTPNYLVAIILDQAGYVSGKILKHHVMENSCGDGQFLIQIVERYCQDFLMDSSDLNELADELELFIHAIEIDKNELSTCMERCSLVAQKYGVIRKLNWDFICKNALNVHEFDGKMDFVVGNPPYVRIHNLSDNFDTVKASLFGNSGMTDLYIAFYELGIRMLNNKGTLCYITPSSFFTSVAGANMRSYFVDHELLKSVCDLKHFQAFEATTYTAIICLKKNNQFCRTDYFDFDDKTRTPVFVESLEPSDYYINGLFYFSSKKNLLLLKNILFSLCIADLSVKNGYATLADTIFIHSFPFDSQYIIPVIKASRGETKKIIFPYDKTGKLISEAELKKDASIYSYLLENKAELLKRSNENPDEGHWFAFGRSQAINDTFVDKLAINVLIRTSTDLKIVKAPAGTGVYSGLYIVSDTISSESICSALMDEEFGVYISLLGKYKSGGYYTFSSKDVKSYLNYKLGSGFGGQNNDE